MKRLLSIFLALALTLSLAACGQKSSPAGSQSSSGEGTELRDNEFTLTKLRMSGRGGASEDYKLAFFPAESMEGVKAFLVCYSVESPETVWDYLSGLSYDELAALDKPVNRGYFITDLSYCDGVGNTLNTAQKDVVTGEPFSEAGDHIFYAATVGEEGLLALARAPQTAFIAPSAGKLDFTREGDAVTGSFESVTDGGIAKNYVFLSTQGGPAVREQLAAGDRAALDALVEQGRGLSFDPAEHTDFTLDLTGLQTLEGQVWDQTGCCYVYAASASDTEFLGVNGARRILTPQALPQSSGTVGTGKGIIFPNGGAAPIGSGRSSIISTSQALFEDFPDLPRIAVLGGASGSEEELWAHFHVDTDSKDSFRTRFADAGFEAVYIPLTAENRDVIGDDPYFAALVSSCHGVYFTGGDQSLGMTSLLNKAGEYNAVGKAVLDLFARGGFLAGTSAGAHMLGDACFQDSDSHQSLTHPVPSRTELTAKGVVCGPEGVLYQGLPCAVDAGGHSLVFDSHFGARGRLARLAVMQKASGAEFAIGLDEATGLAVSDGVGTVYGSGTVTVLDSSAARFTGSESAFGVEGLRLFLLSPGDRFDFSSRTVTPSRAKSPASPAGEPEQPKDLLASDSAQTRALITLAQSGAEQLVCPLEADGRTFEAVLRKDADFAAFTGQRKYSAGVLADLTQTTASGLVLDIAEQNS